MQTMNFQCGHCNNVMAVGTEFLGQQVRCPHCGGVVIAPTAPAPGPDVTRDPEPRSFDPLGLGGPQNTDDIFSQPSGMEDALFGGDAPHLEIPRAAQPESPPASEPAPLPRLETVVPQSELVTETTPPETPTTGWPATAPLTTEPAAAPYPAPEPAYTPPETRRVKAPPKIDWFFPLIFMPLILYAIGITMVTIFLFMRLSAEKPSLFDRMPDVDGDNPGVAKQKVGLNFKKADALAPLPEHLLVQLNDTLRVGDLEVTPLKVERKKVGVFVEGVDRPEPCQNESLVLHLRLKNVGTDYRYTPIDNYFDRHFSGVGAAPLTVLVAGREQFFGGPAKWVPLTRDKRRGERREWLEGRVDSDPKGIGPGEEMETITATDGEDKRCASVIAKHQGKLLWRIHLRRGLIEHKGRRLPAQCVVGVEFTNKDYGG